VTISYSGDTLLPGEFQKLINDSFSRTVRLATEGKVEEALLGCDFILRLDSRFEPARRLEKQVRSDQPIDASVFRSLAGLDTEVEAAPSAGLVLQAASSPAISAAPLPESLADAPGSESEKCLEFRGSVRVPIIDPYRVDVGAGWEYHLQSGLFEAVSCNLGEGGMFVSVANPRTMGSRIDFEAQFAGMGLIEGRGEIAWVCHRASRSHHPPGIGIRFLALHGDSVKEVLRTMESASKSKTLRPAH